VIAALIRRARNSAIDRPRPMPAPDRLIIRPVTDGFWIDSPDIPPGTSIHYRCRRGAAIHEDRFIVSEGPGGLFVYTGGTPADIRILELVPPAGPAKPPPFLDWDSSPPRTSRPSPLRSSAPTPPPRHHDTSHGRPIQHPPAY